MKKYLILFIFVLGLTTINFDSQSVQADSGLIAHWNFDEGTGAILNDVIGGRDGAITGATWTTGFNGSALSFDGIDDYVLTGDVPILNAYTISFVIKSGDENPAANLYPRIINTPANRADVAIVNGNKIYYNIKGDAFHDSLTTASTDAWSFITMTYDGSSRKFYQNGVLKHTKNVSGADLVGPNSQPGGLSFGRNSSYGSNDSYAKIYLDDVKLYNRALSDNEISAEYDDRECAQDTWECGGWNECQPNSQQTRNCSITKECSFVDTPSPANTQYCAYTPPVCTSWTYSDWSNCSANGEQTRNIIASSPNSCNGGNPILSQTCNYIPTCTANDWSCTDWSSCPSSGKQTRTCNKTSNCQGGVSAPAASQSCAYVPACASNSWSCGDWGTCSPSGIKSRICNKVSNCEGGTQSPTTAQSCTYTPPCSEDTWQCADWNSCSPNGIQTRSCKRTYDCPSAETPPPATSQYCQAPFQPQAPSSGGGGSSAQPNNSINEDVNQDSIIQATVKLICLINATSGKQGSGTVIDPKGIILTNRHVVESTKGCVVGFINNSDDDPSFTEVADIIKLSADEDIALIKIRNNGSKTFVYSDISTGSVNSKNLGNKIMIFGYPSIGGAKLTYSDGAVSGFGSAKDGMSNYLKTTAVIEHGNSGGGAYLMNNKSFIGIPSAGIKGELASIGYILSVNKIKSWMSGSGLAYNGSGFKNLSSKSIKASSLLENINIDNVNILDVSSANVSIYSSKTKTTLLPNNPGTIQIYNRPAFEINNVDEESGVVGYYMYFGTNIKADPVKKGKLIKKPKYTPATIAKKGTYYFIFRVKKNGNISEPVITEYRYKK